MNNESNFQMSDSFKSSIDLLIHDMNTSLLYGLPYPNGRGRYTQKELELHNSRRKKEFCGMYYATLGDSKVVIRVIKSDITNNYHFVTGYANIKPIRLYSKVNIIRPLRGMDF